MSKKFFYVFLAIALAFLASISFTAVIIFFISFCVLFGAYYIGLRFFSKHQSVKYFGLLLLVFLSMLFFGEGFFLNCVSILFFIARLFVLPVLGMTAVVVAPYCLAERFLPKYGFAKWVGLLVGIGIVAGPEIYFDVKFHRTCEAIKVEVFDQEKYDLFMSIYRDVPPQDIGISSLPYNRVNITDSKQLSEIPNLLELLKEDDHMRGAYYIYDAVSKEPLFLFYMTSRYGKEGYEKLVDIQGKKVVYQIKDRLIRKSFYKAIKTIGTDTEYLSCRSYNQGGFRSRERIQPDRRHDEYVYVRSFIEKGDPK